MKVSGKMALTFVVLFGVVLITFVICDLIWLTNVTTPAFKKEIGSILRGTPDATAAIGFYLMYAAGIVAFAAYPALQNGSLMEAAIRGAAIGFFAYMTYELTNMATIEGWKWHMVWSDTAWGVFLTGLAAMAGVMAANLLGFGPE